MAKEIFKVQVPLATNEPVPVAMIYNKGRKDKHLVPISDSIKKFMGSDLKKFCYGKFDVVLDQFDIQGAAPFQDW